MISLLSKKFYKLSPMPPYYTFVSAPSFLLRRMHSKNIPQRVLGCWHNPTDQQTHAGSQDSAMDVELRDLHTPSQLLAEFDAPEPNTKALDCLDVAQSRQAMSQNCWHSMVHKGVC